MKKSRRTYTEEFKEHLVLMSAQVGSTIRSVADEYNVTPATIVNWRKKFAHLNPGQKRVIAIDRGITLEEARALMQEQRDRGEHINGYYPTQDC